MSDNVIAFYLCGIGFFSLLFYWHSRNDSFDLRWLLVDTKTNKVSLFKLGQLVALCVSSWALVHQTINNVLTEWLFTGYMIAWAGANIAKKFLDKDKLTDTSK